MDVTLVMFTIDGTRRDFPLTKPRVTVGRTTHADLRIPLSSVSRKHCEFRIGDGVELHDLKSSNGTYHNGQRIDTVKLRPGDRVGIGPVQFTVVIDGQPRDIEAVPTILNGHDAASGSAGHSHATQAADAPAARKSGKPAAPPDASALAADILEGSDPAAPAAGQLDGDDSALHDLDDLSESSSLPLADDEDDPKK